MPNNAVALLLLIGGLLFALFYAWLSITDGTAEYCIEFAIACLVAVIGWNEIGAVDQIGESSER